MGIRFHCHHCDVELHVKDFQAGKRGRCPSCAGAFRIPLSDADKSLPPESRPTAHSPANDTTDQPDRSAEPTSSIETASAKESNLPAPPSAGEAIQRQKAIEEQQPDREPSTTNEESLAPLAEASAPNPPFSSKEPLPQTSVVRIHESAAEMKRRKRKLQRQKNYALGILLLFFVFIGLIVALFVVLMRQS